MTRFSGASSAMHTTDRSLPMVDLSWLRRGERRAGTAASSETLSRVIASGHEGLTRVLVAGDEVLSVVISGM
ncbi:hypothetical protein [Escherichia coli]|uniref:hypothetical protein n=1 Tax=Escherichia coli TaxID=562 RepID=UPI0010CC01C4|nr:hypothetical protein [Escherichia coli]EFB1498258.1 hypothetical protein [Escherichia coli]EFE1629374.1 hypothetical protein [Escherichia coli]EFH7398726.1 hypothetical protein [Escherichia coli]EHL8011006.1 hypothetical protein [Escherichia coli]EIA4170886.1 hypothetical protein [Escherichia coli]